MGFSKTALSVVLLSLLAISQVACQKPNNNSAKYKFPPKIAGAVEAVLLGVNIVNQTGQVTGDVSSAGRVSLALIKTNTSTFDIRYNVTIQVSSPEIPTTVTINSGAAKTSGAVVLELSPSATWINVTGTVGAIATGNAWGQGARRSGIGAKPASVPVYTYSFNGTWQNVSGLTTANGKSYKAVFEASAKPKNFYSVVSSASLSAGSARGQFAKVPLGWGSAAAGWPTHRPRSAPPPATLPSPFTAMPPQSPSTRPLIAHPPPHRTSAPSSHIRPLIAHPPPHRTSAPSSHIRPLIAHPPPHRTSAPSSHIRPLIAHPPPHRTSAPSSHIGPLIAHPPPHRTSAPSSHIRPLIAHPPPHRTSAPSSHLQVVIQRVDPHIVLDQLCHLPQRRRGTAEERHSGGEAQRRRGTAEKRHSGGEAQRRRGTAEKRHSGEEAQRRRGTAGKRHSGEEAQRRRGTAEERHSGTFVWKRQGGREAEGQSGRATERSGTEQ
ncbi:unnamed protein product [Closterium sp. Naga37s-1]|nr:unnamed protein product [Closterium sp. Naga37s-1]